jgi:Acetyltransferase (GNAT) domain
MVAHPMNIFEIDPLEDPRWPELLRRNSSTSAFHTLGWLRALQRTYRYRPVAFTTSPDRSELSNALVFCEIKSWLTGSRLVSLPFSDHCQPLVDDASELRCMLDCLKEQAQGRSWKYIELRPLRDEHLGDRTSFSKYASYSFHKIDLRPPMDTIFRNFHESCVRRKIRRAEREQLTYEAGRSDALLKKFRHLFLLTRRRHRLPPPPLSWFKNVMSYLDGQLIIHVASKGTEPVASIVTISHKTTLMYKYGCSNATFNNLGGTSFLFWRAIQEGKQSGAEEFDLGRSDVNDPGLVSFKEHLGGFGSQLSYYRDSFSPTQKTLPGFPHLRHAFARMPDPVFTGAGRLLYKHMG